MANFQSLLDNGFGVVTVLDMKVYDGPTQSDLNAWALLSPEEIVPFIVAKGELATIQTLKISNPSQEGPTKTIMGGLRNAKLIKWGKTARLEMQDALVNIDALEHIGGAQILSSHGPSINIGFGYAGVRSLIGTTVYVDRNTGEEVQVKLVFYSFLPDSIVSLTMSAADDAAAIDLNGDLNGIEIEGGSGIFYSIIEATATPNVIIGSATAEVLHNYAYNLQNAQAAADVTWSIVGAPANLVISSLVDGSAMVAVDTGAASFVVQAVVGLNTYTKSVTIV